MPTYEYACDACGHEFEREQRITAEPIRECPSCAKPSARRMIGGGSFILKGGGWEADGYSKAGAQAAPSCGASPCAGCPNAEA